MKLAFTALKSFEQELYEAPLTQFADIHFFTETITSENLDIFKGYEALCIFTADDLSSSNLQHLHKNGLKCVLLRCAGYDNVDLAKAAELAIKVYNVPAYSPYAIAEHTVALILALNRNLKKAGNKAETYDFTLDGLMGFDMNTRTVGLIGIGKIGGIVVRLMSAFGCRVLAYDPYPSDEYTSIPSFRFTTLDEVLTQSDIISLHCPLNTETKYLINAETINKMKPGAMIINTSRGPIVDTQAAYNALISGKLSALGLDVYEREKGVFFYNRSDETNKDSLLQALIEHQNVIITPHSGFLTTTAVGNMKDATVANLSAYLGLGDAAHQLT